MDKPTPIAKVLPFPRGGRAGTGGPRRERVISSQLGLRWFRSRPFWLGWWVLAWIVAASRLQVAVAQREVFGLDATCALLVAAILALMAAPTLYEYARAALTAVQHARALRRASAAPPPRSSRRSA